MMQGYYFCRPIPFEKILERYQKGIQIGFENPEESGYYAAVGKVNLYDLAILSNDDQVSFEHYFNTVPMAIIETKDNRFKLYYRIMFGGRPVRVCLKAALIEESDGPQLIIGVTNMEIRADGGERTDGGD